MFSLPQTTPYDLCFRLFGFPVRVHPLFWLTMLLFGPKDLNAPHAGVAIATWIVAAFVSLLVHELGHAFAYRYYRCPGAGIWLYWFGGLAGGVSRPHGHWPNIVISLAGPGAQLLLLAVAYYSNEATQWSLKVMPYSLFFYFWLYQISLYWALLNLLPVYPLDGGQVARELCHLGRVPQPEQASLKLSMGTAIAVAVVGVVAFAQPELLAGWPWWLPVPGLFGVLLFASLAYASWEALQNYRGRYHYE